MFHASSLTVYNKPTLCARETSLVIFPLLSIILSPLVQITMSSRRSRQSSGSTTSSRISDDQIISLVSRLQQFLPEIRTRRSSKVSASKVLQETCNYIRNLNREVDDLSDRLSQLLATVDADSDEAAIIRSLIMQ